MSPSRRILPLAVLPLLALAGCGGTDLSRTFGLTRDAPDEFAVTTQVPLSMPPDYTLRAPVPGAPRPQAESPSRAAEADLAPKTALGGASGAMSPGQQALVQAAGPTPPANIRSQVNAEAANAASGSLTDTLMFWRKPTPPGVVVDPAAEAKRLRENAALGQSERSGDTPIIQPASKGLLDRLF
ncbi:MAG: DUF3035 domain-containing protein [Rhodospirillales bacterium]|nr:DUF3035 domain-containing protein [Rhodospirillales bacterium]MDE2574608.1 DUF3035 domain-containing protein [Rhodospirillales bacterium]